MGKFNVSHILAFTGMVYIFMFMSIFSIIGALIIGIIILSSWIVLELEKQIKFKQEKNER